MRRTRFRYPLTTLAGSTLKNIRALNESHFVAPKYRSKFILSKAVAGALELFSQMERLIWQKRIRNHHLKTPPVFIIGFWRSGTTLLHNLLCQDPEAAYTTTFQTVFPNLILTQSWWLKPLVNRFLPAQRPFDNVRMDMDFPQEEDFGLMNIQPVAIYKFLIYPAEFDSIVEQELFTADLTPEMLAQWKEAYQSMIAKAMFNTGGTRYTGKNPCHLTRINLLMQMFPGVKFIFIHRHPYKVIESFYRFILSIIPGVQLQDIPPDFSREKIVMLYCRMMNAYFRDREMIPSSDLVEMKMDDFLCDIPAHLEMIYDKFQMGDYSSVSARMEKFLSENPCPPRKKYIVDPKTIKLVDQYASGILNELGYHDGLPDITGQEHSG